MLDTSRHGDGGCDARQFNPVEGSSRELSGKVFADEAPAREGMRNVAQAVETHLLEALAHRVTNHQCAANHRCRCHDPEQHGKVRAPVVDQAAGEELSGSQVIAHRVPEGGPDKRASYSVLDETVRMGSEYEYRLVSIEKDGRRVIAARSRVLVMGGASSSYSLTVYPNPIRDRGEVAWRAPRGEEVDLRVLDLQGKELLSDRLISEGDGVLSLDASDLSSGVYIVELRSGDQILTQRITVAK